MRTTTLIILLFLASLSFGQKIKNASAEEFKKEIAAGKAVLIDLRTDDELASKGMIKGARQIDYFSKDAEAQLLKLDKNKTYLLYCAGGGRSGEAAELMSKNGFKNLVNLAKGFDDWKKKGFEVVKK